MNEAAVSAPASNIIALFPQKSVGNGAELGHREPESQSKAEILIEAKDAQSEYAKDWTNVADGIYRYEPSGTLFYRPTNPDGGRTYRSLKTKNLKIAVERYQRLKGTQGNVAESKLKVGDIITKYAEDDYPGEDLQKRRDETKTDEKRHCDKLKKFWANNCAKTKFQKR